MNMKTQKEKNLEIIKKYNQSKGQNQTIYGNQVPNIVKYAQRQNEIYALVEAGATIHYDDLHYLSTEVKYPTKETYDKKTGKLIMRPVDQSKLVSFLTSVIETNNADNATPENILYQDTTIYKDLRNLLHSLKSEPIVQSSRFMPEDKLVHATKFQGGNGADPTLIVVEDGSYEQKILTGLLENVMLSCPSLVIDYEPKNKFDDGKTYEELDSNYESLLEIVRG